MKNILSRLLFCFCISATAQTNNEINDLGTFLCGITYSTALDTISGSYGNENFEEPQNFGAYNFSLDNSSIIEISYDMEVWDCNMSCLADAYVFLFENDSLVNYWFQYSDIWQYSSGNIPSEIELEAGDYTLVYGNYNYQYYPSLGMSFDDAISQIFTYSFNSNEHFTFQLEFFAFNETCDYPGCTDSSVLNFNTYATIDDGSCEYPSELGALECGIALNTAIDTINGGQGSQYPKNYAAYDFNIDYTSLIEISYNLNIFDNDCDWWNCNPYVSVLLFKNDTLIYGWDDYNNPLLVLELDTGSYSIVYGAYNDYSCSSCMIGMSFNDVISDAYLEYYYNEGANFSFQIELISYDGDCDYPGCTDSSALNFNSYATINNGTCEYPTDLGELQCGIEFQQTVTISSEYGIENSVYYSFFLDNDSEISFNLGDNSSIYTLDDSSIYTPYIILFDSLQNYILTIPYNQPYYLNYSHVFNSGEYYFVITSEFPDFYDGTLSDYTLNMINNMQGLGSLTLSLVSYDGTCEYPGCNDSTALNYNSVATLNDNSCHYPTNIDSLECGIETVLSGDITSNYGFENSSYFTFTIENNSEIIINYNNNYYPYIFIFDSSQVHIQTLGYSTSSTINNASLNLDNGKYYMVATTSNPYFQSTETLTAYYLNLIDDYNSTSSYTLSLVIDDGTCDVLGCTDSNACNYDENNTDDDGSCDYISCLDDCGVINGDNSSCTDCSGVLFGSFTEDDCGICDNDSSNDCILGCMDQLAFNYDISATVDQGNCEYATDLGVLECGFLTEEFDIIDNNYGFENSVYYTFDLENNSEIIINLRVWAGYGMSNPYILLFDSTETYIQTIQYSEDYFIHNYLLEDLMGKYYMVVTSGNPEFSNGSLSDYYQDMQSNYQGNGQFTLSLISYDSSCYHYGCTDTLALNYDSFAEVNDNSCEYPIDLGVLNCGGQILFTEEDQNHQSSEYFAFELFENSEIIINLDASGSFMAPFILLFDSSQNYIQSINYNEPYYINNYTVNLDNGEYYLGVTANMSSFNSGTLSDYYFDESFWLQNLPSFTLNLFSNNDSCPFIEGCTELFAANYNPYANLDDGSCHGPCQDPLACNYNVTELSTDELCTYADHGFDCNNNFVSMSCHPFHNSNGYFDNFFGVHPSLPVINNETIINVSQAGIDYTFQVVGLGGYSQGDCDVDYVYLDGDLSDIFGSPLLNGASIEIYTEGCTDSDALNYDLDADIDDGSCIVQVFGCTDSDALNYDPDANLHDGSCIFEELEFNPEWNDDPDNITSWSQWCEYEINNNLFPAICANSYIIYNCDLFCGCTDESAVNYDANANIDNGQCQFDSVCQIIDLPSGWSIFSTFIIPDNLSIQFIFEPIFDNVLIVKNNTGSVYLPEYDFNGIGNLLVGQGYQVKIDSEVSLELCGEYAIPEENQIFISEGWNMIGYLRIEPASLENIFADMINSGNLIMVKDYLGSVYLPEYNFNGIGEMQAGQGYQIKVSETDILQY